MPDPPPSIIPFLLALNGALIAYTLFGTNWLFWGYFVLTGWAFIFHIINNNDKL